MLTEEKSNQLSNAVTRLDQLRADIVKQPLSDKDRDAALSRMDQIRKETEDAMKRFQAASAREVAFKEHQKRFQEVQKSMQAEFTKFKTSSRSGTAAESNLLQLLDEQEEVLATINNILTASRNALIVARILARIG